MQRDKDETFKKDLYKFADQIVTSEFDFLKECKSICVCGNGPDDYAKGVSNKLIEQHDVVVRMNSYKLVPEISGTKTTFHFIGSINRRFHTDEKNHPVFPHKNQCDYIISNQNQEFNQKLEEEVKPTVPVIKIKTSLIHELIKEKIIKKKYRINMTGVFALLLFKAIQVKYQIPKFSIFGMGGHKLVNNNQQYYYGNRKLDAGKARFHEKSHFWKLQEILVDLFKKHHFLNK
mgnify:CR=1 FL=1